MGFQTITTKQKYLKDAKIFRYNTYMYMGFIIQ